MNDEQMQVGNTEELKIPTQVQDTQGNQSAPQFYERPVSSINQASQMNQVPPRMNQVPPQMNQVPPQMNQVPPRMNQVPPRMNQVPPQMNQVPPQMNQVPPRMNQVSPQMNQVPPQTNQVPPQYNYVQMNPQQKPGASGFAIASMVLGIVSVITVCWSWLLGLVCGIVGLVFAGVDKGKGGEHPMMIAGLVCSIIGICLACVSVFIEVINYL